MFTKIKTARAWFSNPYEFLDQLSLSNTYSFDLNLPMLGNCFLTGDPAYIEAIQKNKDLVGGAGTQFLNAIVGNSVITQSLESHAKKRKALNPFFYTGDMAVVDQMTSARMTDALKHLKADQTVSIEETVEEVTLRVILDFIFGDLPSAHYEPILAAVHGWKKSFSNPLFLFLKPLQVPLSKNFGWGRFLYFRELLRNLIRGEIREPHFENRSGFLHAFQSKTTDAPWSDDDLVWEVISVLVFGHDTGSVAIAWWVYHVLRNGAWAALKNDSIIESSLKEAMRLSPPVVHLTRVAKNDTTLLSKKIEAGRRVLPCIYLAHHNRNVFEMPYEFRADRFLTTKNDFKFAFIPFGFGDRLCLGKNFAERQMLYVAKALLERTELELCGRNLKAARKLVLMAPEGGTPVLIKKIRSGL